MNTKNTSGPWSFSTPSGDVFADEKLVASVYGDDPECRPDDRLLANARLIAAAPELLEALKEMLLQHGVRGGSGPSARAGAAIAKATGEAA